MKSAVLKCEGREEEGEPLSKHGTINMYRWICVGQSVPATPGKVRRGFTHYGIIPGLQYVSLYTAGCGSLGGGKASVHSAEEDKDKQSHPNSLASLFWPFFILLFLF